LDPKLVRYLCAEGAFADRLDGGRSIECRHRPVA
jgi:hypothetical protein